ncbi:MAG: hypothetical protein EOP11_12910 [Proteobacteria bacterium]|nr:MAG: hypothetical protein EOP11_12910 [Pseudomonadota bacterium]
MKKFFALFCLSFLFITGRAYATSDAEVVRGYRACMVFMKSSPKQQKAIAKKTGLPFAKVLAGCQYQKKVGLARMRAGVAEYRKAKRGGGRTKPEPTAPSWPDPEPTPTPTPPAPRTCSVSAQGYGCSDSSQNVSTSGCFATCYNGQTPSCWQGSVDTGNCIVSQEDRCSCY